MSDYRLYCFAQSGNAYKVALMLALCDVDWEPQFVDFFNGETRTPEFRKINVLGEVPVLEHRGERLTQSGVILDYLAVTTGRFSAGSAKDGREILRWLFWDNHKLTSYTGTYRFLKNFTKNETPAVTDFLGARMTAAFKILDEHLRSRSFVVAERPTIADLSLCGYLFFDDEIGVNWGEYPGIEAWLERIKAFPGWKHPYDLMPGHPRKV